MHYIKTGSNPVFLFFYIEQYTQKCYDKNRYNNKTNR